MARRAQRIAWLLALAPTLPAAMVAAQPSAPIYPRPAWSAVGSASASASAPVDTGTQPDPPPLTTKRKWVYRVIYDGGAFFVPTPVAVDKPKPTETPRRMGRFLLELYVGKTLLDRVRFDLPLLTGESTGPERLRPGAGPPDFERKLRTSATVELPDSARATYALLVDRATGRRMRVPWPAADVAPAGSSSSAASVIPASSVTPAASR